MTYPAPPKVLSTAKMVLDTSRSEQDFRSQCNRQSRWVTLAFTFYDVCSGLVLAPFFEVLEN